MRIRIKHRPPATSVDGIRLEQFEPGCQYDVGTALGSLLLSEGWGEPVAAEEGNLAVPLSKTQPGAESAGRGPRRRANHSK
jgi:hypothetical protein